MFGLTQPKLPISTEHKEWVDQTFVRLSALLGAERLFNATVMLPTPEYFPDTYDGSERGLQAVLNRVANAMQIDPASVEVTIFREEHRVTRETIPFYSGSSSGAGGLYYHDSLPRAEISINKEHLRDPAALVAVLAHELGHVMLLRPGLVGQDEPDMEPMNDLLTVFLGFGVFTANAAFRFHQFTDFQAQGWSTQRLGYLPQEMFGYALARFTFERNDPKPAWKSFLTTNVASYMKRSYQWLVSHREQHLFS